METNCKRLGPYNRRTDTNGRFDQWYLEEREMDVCEIVQKTDKRKTKKSHGDKEIFNSVLSLSSLTHHHDKYCQSSSRMELTFSYSCHWC